MIIIFRYLMASTVKKHTIIHLKYISRISNTEIKSNNSIGNIQYLMIMPVVFSEYLCTKVFIPDILSFCRSCIWWIRIFRIPLKKLHNTIQRAKTMLVFSKEKIGFSKARIIKVINILPLYSPSVTNPGIGNLLILKGLIEYNTSKISWNNKNM